MSPVSLAMLITPVVRLFDVEPDERRRHGPSRALVPVDRSRCPACGASTIVAVMAEPALFYFGGYGATRRSTTVACPDRHCRWAMVVEIAETNPRRP